eukprot:1196431-Prorocentrum_minimum.AAC.1
MEFRELPTEGGEQHVTFEILGVGGLAMRLLQAEEDRGMRDADVPRALREQARQQGVTESDDV